MKTSYPKLHSIKWKGDGANNPKVHCLQSRAQDGIPAYDVLVGAHLADLKDVVLVGYDQFGEEYVAGSITDPKKAHYLFSRGALAMMRLGDD